jgi:hypothetical protein
MINFYILGDVGEYEYELKVLADNLGLDEAIELHDLYQEDIEVYICVNA